MSDIEITERVAAGLRQVSRTPDAMLFVREAAQWTWDRREVLGIAVLHADGIAAHCWGGIAGECPFIPVWSSEHGNAALDVARFSQGYVEWREKGGA